MNTNLGSIDRGLRIVLGIAIIVYGVLNTTWLGAIGAIPLLTALAGWCPLYTIVGISSCSKKGCSLK